MRELIILFIFFAISPAFSQLIIHAGNDAAVCVSWNSTSQLILGGNPTAQGGTPPYSYSWEANYEYTVGATTYQLTASDFLSDTSISNPEVILQREDPVTFVLRVTDADFNTVSDTVKVYFSHFNTHLTEYNHQMLAGDSVKFVSLPNVGGGTAPLTYLWRPNHGLTDSISYTDFWVQPTVSTSYFLTITDAFGCVVSGSPVFHVVVSSLGLENLSDNGRELLLYPNPTSGKIVIESDKPVTEITFFDSQMKLVRSFKQSLIDIEDLPAGTYFLRVDTINDQYFKKVLLFK